MSLFGEALQYLSEICGDAAHFWGFVVTGSVS